MKLVIHIDPLYAYILLVFVFAIIWAILFSFGSFESRREQIIMSLVGLVLGPVTELLYFTDYWMPQSIFSFNVGSHPVLLEDLLFGFFFAGAVSVLYTSLSRKVLRGDYNFQHFVHLATFSAMATGMVIILWLWGVNSIFATTAGFIAVTASVLVLRPDLYKSALWSGLLTSGLLFVIYFVGFSIVSNSDSILSQTWFLFDANLGLRLLKVPVSELVWGFGAGMMVGTIYKVASGKRIYSLKTGFPSARSTG